MENEGLWSKINNKVEYKLGNYTLEDFQKIINDIYPKTTNDTSIEIPAAYLISCSDEEFKTIYRSKNNYKIITGLENYNKIEERRRKLIK